MLAEPCVTVVKRTAFSTTTQATQTFVVRQRLTEGRPALVLGGMRIYYSDRVQQWRDLRGKSREFVVIFKDSVFRTDYK